MAAATETRRIVIKVDSGDSAKLTDIANKLGNVSKQTSTLARGMDLLSAGASAWLGRLSIGTLTGFSDEIQSMNNRLLAMTGSQEEASATMKGLVDISRSTNQTLAATAESYFRMSLALKDASISQETLLDMTKTIANTFRLSGATAQEAANATIQLGQSFSLGVLRGQDLRSVMSQNVALTRILRQEFGNDLLKAAEKGLITVPKIMELLRKNMDDVNKSADLMAATFEQSLNKAIDSAKLKVFEIASAMGAAGAFGKAVDSAIANIGALSTAFAILAIPAALAGLASIVATLTTLNPIVTGLTAALAGFVAIFGESWDIGDLVVQVQSGFSKIRYEIAKTTEDMYRWLATGADMGGMDQMKKKFDELAKAAQRDAILHLATSKAVWVEYEARKELNKILSDKKATDAAKRWREDIEKAMKAFSPTKTPEQMLSELNTAFATGALGVAEYNRRILEFDLSKANYQFREGKIQLSQLNDAIQKVALFKLNRDFKDGRMTVEQYRDAVRDLELKSLKEDLESGKISLLDFNRKMAAVANEFSAGGAFRAGLTDYITSIGTTTQQVANAIKGAFTQLEDYFLNFIKSGRFEFAKFAQAILDDLTKIIIRASIIQPLASGILSFLPTAAASGTTVTAPASNASYANFAAKGAYFDNNIAKFASGGVVSSATMFGYGAGKLGVMGEAGPEAILPLRRGSGGDLGVQASVTPVTINIVNQSGSQVEQTETTGPNGEKTIEILITNTVREGFANGRFDKSMKQAYGLNRKGS